MGLNVATAGAWRCGEANGDLADPHEIFTVFDRLCGERGGLPAAEGERSPWPRRLDAVAQEQKA